MYLRFIAFLESGKNNTLIQFSRHTKLSCPKLKEVLNSNTEKASVPIDWNPITTPPEYIYTDSTYCIHGAFLIKIIST